MINADLIKTLTEVGLSENQSKVYLALLSLGQATPVEIARQAEIKRTTVYPVIESLKELGVVNSIVKGRKQAYVAENPEKLDLIVEMRHAQLKQSLGELTALYSLKSRASIIKYYEGVASIKKVYNGLLEDVRPKEDYFIISGPDKWFALDPVFFENFALRRAKLDVNICAMFADSQFARKYQRNQKKYNMKTKILPRGAQFTANIVIIPKKLVIHQLVPPIWAIVIENQDIVKANQSMFRLLWQSTGN